MIDVDKIQFRVNSTFDGIGNYIIYDQFDCTGNTITTGNTNIVNGTSFVVINESISLTENISINFTDINGCEICENYNIDITGTTTTTSSTTLEPPPTECTYYRSGGVATADGHCEEELGYTATLALYSNSNNQPDCTIPSLLNKFVYTDTNLSTPFNGGGSYYFISAISGENNKDLLTSQNFYFVVRIETNGEITTVIQQDCDEGPPI